MKAPSFSLGATPRAQFAGRHQMIRAWRDFPAGLAMLAPSLLVFAVFVFFPLFYTLYLSGTNWNMISPQKAFVGLQNYEKLFRTPLFWKVLSNTAIFTVSVVLLSLIIGLGLALLLNQRIVGRSLYRATIFSPYVTTPAALALVWLWIFAPQYGLLNSALSVIGIRGPDWLVSTEWALPALIIMSIWRFTGYDMVVFLGGLQNIPVEIREAARMDGVTPWSEFWHITLPLLSPTTFFIVTTAAISLFQVFDIVCVMTFGGPADATNVIVFYLYLHAFRFFEAGYASAVAVVLFAMVLVMTAAQFRLSGRWVHY